MFQQHTRHDPHWSSRRRLRVKTPVGQPCPHLLSYPTGGTLRQAYSDGGALRQVSACPRALDNDEWVTPCTICRPKFVAWLRLAVVRSKGGRSPSDVVRCCSSQRLVCLGRSSPSAQHPTLRLVLAWARGGCACVYSARLRGRVHRANFAFCSSHDEASRSEKQETKSDESLAVSLFVSLPFSRSPPWTSKWNTAPLGVYVSRQTDPRSRSARRKDVELSREKKKK